MAWLSRHGRVPMAVEAGLAAAVLQEVTLAGAISAASPVVALERHRLSQRAVSAVMPVAAFAPHRCFTAGLEVLGQSAVRRDPTPAALVRLP